MATLADIGERDAIRMVQKILGRRAQEAARLDDAAVVRLKDGATSELVATTDTLTFASHLLPGTPLRLFGYFCCAVSISDLAAMGAKPHGMLLAVGLPATTAVGDLEDLTLGFRMACNQLDFDVWGGDLKEAPTPHITGTAMGTVPRGKALRRGRGIKAGWPVATTGFLGRAAMGALLAKRGDAVGFEMVYLIEPRVGAGLAAVDAGGPIACIDSSDGLSASLLHLCASNPGVGFEVDAGELPVYPGLRKEAGPVKALELALDGAGDYELVFCAPPRTLDRLKDELSDLRIPLTRIGKAVAEEGLFLIRDGAREAMGLRGFEHFRTPVTGTG